MDNGLFNRLHAAALRSLCGNGSAIIGKDGRQFVTLESVSADAVLANLLREIGGEIPRHSAECAVHRKIAVCDCAVIDRVREIEAGG